ncbi:synaptobrevin [Coemansia reversa NRRL 1564]|uniref:Synaptobrevin n=1 Tax=Coemansia reversa (strain ATCC 12441 / NRRL 1564) TaxID=763665 RepID=A0A2G5BJS2_COERN|nr:synaptobrevin [Coemansia reversa NRRL 1564]|eukprot:PIA19260.1 synaptobrevin [Coemansia reversa NRRL 1564]
MSYNANYGNSDGGGGGGYSSNPYASYSSDNNPPGEGQGDKKLTKAQDVQLKINDAVDVMNQNIQQLNDRGDNLDVVMDKSERLRGETEMFQRSAVRVRKKMWWNNMKWKIIIGVCVLIIILVIVLSVVLSKNKDK